MIGKLLGGKYQIVRLLGAGGMGSVYEAKNTSIGRRVALKTLLHGKTATPAAIARFGREAFVAGAIESDHTAAVLDAGNDPETGTAYIVMEFLQGEDLAAVFQRAPILAPLTATRIAAQMLEGLRAAHAAGISHRDIKPPNVFLVRKPNDQIVVKLVDFGIARSLFQDDSPASKKVTATGSLLGTPPYMSPEQLAGQADVDHRTDLWSLGVLMFEMLTGRSPYADAGDLAQLFTRICFVPPPLVAACAPWVPAEVAAVVQKAMCQNRDERYASAEAALVDVMRILQGQTSLTQAMLDPFSPPMPPAFPPPVDVRPGAAADLAPRPVLPFQPAQGVVAEPSAAASAKVTPPAVTAALRGSSLSSSGMSMDAARHRKLVIAAGAIAAGSVIVLVLVFIFAPPRTKSAALDPAGSSAAMVPTATTAATLPMPPEPGQAATGGAAAANPPATASALLAAPTATGTARPARPGVTPVGTGRSRL